MLGVNMRCIFCKINSSDSKSVEHILPESLGNSMHVLPKGIVCDKCNNYFSRKVERLVLENLYFRTLRSEQGVLSKKKRMAKVPVYIPKMGMQLEASFSLVDKPQESHQIIFSRTKDFELFKSKWEKNKPTSMFFPIHSGLPPEGLMGRLLAKMALEVLAHKLECIPLAIEEVVLDEQLDEIRAFARTGMKPDFWPYNQRRIYETDRKIVMEDGQEGQTMHEFDILVTKNNEYFFVIVIFGVEYAINFGGPEICGYEQWLIDHDDQSILYMNKSELYASYDRS